MPCTDGEACVQVGDLQSPLREMEMLMWGQNISHLQKKPLKPLSAGAVIKRWLYSPVNTHFTHKNGNGKWQHIARSGMSSLHNHRKESSKSTMTKFARTFIRILRARIAHDLSQFPPAHRNPLESLGQFGPYSRLITCAHVTPPIPHSNSLQVHTERSNLEMNLRVSTFRGSHKGIQDVARSRSTVSNVML